MTGSAVTRLRYELHGIPLEVSADDDAVLEAIDLRLRDFRVELANGAPTSVIHVSFVADGAPAREEPDGWVEVRASAGRPVYGTPHGSLRYVPGRDVVHGTIGDVRLHCEPTRGLAVLRARQFAGSALYFATHPLTTVALMELLERRGLFSLHAACLASGVGAGVLLSGPSGAGKSTLALALARRGMSFLSDDLVFLDPTEDGEPLRILGFADALGLTPYGAEQFVELRGRLGAAATDGFPKPLGRIEDLLRVTVVAACRPHAVVFPKVDTERPSELAPLDTGEALLRLVPDVLLTDADATQRHLDAIGALLREVNCYALRCGHNLERAAELVSALV
jgi:hypothetical protein